MRVLRIYHSGVVAAWRERDRELRSLGVDVTLVTARRWNEGGADVRCEPGLDDFVVGVHTVGRHPYRFAYNPLPIWRLLRSEKFDVVDVHEEPGSLAHAEVRLLARFSRNRRTPMTFYGAQNIAKRYPIPFRWFEQGAFRRCAATYPCNEDAGQIFRDKGYRGIVQVIGLGVDVERFSAADRETPEGRIRVGYVGRLEEHKGVQVVIEALAGSEHQLHVYGDGPYREVLRSLAGECGTEVVFHGYQTQEQLTSAYRSIDVLVVPSQTRANWVEQFGRVVIEAMASGVPVIVSRSGSLPELVGAAGVVVDEGDPALWRSAIDSLIDDSERWRQLRSAGLDRSQRYSWPAIAREHGQLYERAVSEGSSGRLRVVYLGHTAKLSGGELALARLLPSLPDVDAHVILGEDGPLVKRLQDAGATVEVLPFRAREIHREQVRMGRLPVRAAWETGVYTLRVARRLRALRPDVVHTNTLKAAFYGGVAGRLARVPVVWHIRDRISDDYLPKGAARVVRALGNVLPKAIICNSAATLETMASQRRPTVVVPSAVIFDSVVAQERRGCAQNVRRIGIVGRIAPWKGQDVFVRAFALAFPEGDVEASIVGSAMFGEDAFEASLKSLVEDLGIGDRIEFRGFCEDVEEEYRRLDLVVHASTIPEPFGQVVIEAMAAGVPVIASDDGGPAEVVTHGIDGWLVPPGNVTELSAAMRRLADDGALRSQLAANGYARAADFSPELVGARVRDVYEQRECQGRAAL